MQQDQSLLDAMYSITVAGIPVAVFAWGIFIALLNDIDSSRVSNRKISQIAARIMLEALVAGWVAWFLVRHEYFAQYKLQNVGMTIVSSVIVYFMPQIKRYGPPLVKQAFSKVWNVFLETLARWASSKLPAPPTKTPPDETGE